MRKSHRCIAPLRVPVCTLTEHCSRAVDSTLSSAESYTCIPEGRISKLCKHLSLLALGLGFAVARAHPRGLLRPRKERGCYTYCSRLSCISLFVQYVKVRFVVNRWGIEPRPLWGLALSCGHPISCPFPRL